ncbi:MAG: response regulator [Myxococcota bacterium]
MQKHESLDTPGPASAPARSLQTHGTILFADDEEILRTLARYVAEESSYRVRLARDGRDAVETFRSAGHGIDLVLLDLTMPRMDGIAAACEIRALDPGVPIVLTTGWTDGDVPANDAVDEVLTKPWTPTDLMDLVDRLTQR